MTTQDAKEKEKLRRKGGKELTDMKQKYVCSVYYHRNIIFNKGWNWMK